MEIGVCAGDCIRFRFICLIKVEIGPRFGGLHKLAQPIYNADPWNRPLRAHCHWGRRISHPRVLSARTWPKGLRLAQVSECNLGPQGPGGSFACKQSVGGRGRRPRFPLSWALKRLCRRAQLKSAAPQGPRFTGHLEGGPIFMRVPLKGYPNGAHV